jgi:hypothetical protein
MFTSLRSVMDVCRSSRAAHTAALAVPGVLLPLAVVVVAAVDGEASEVEEDDELLPQAARLTRSPSRTAAATPRGRWCDMIDLQGAARRAADGGPATGAASPHRLRRGGTSAYG